MITYNNNYATNRHRGIFPGPIIWSEDSGASGDDQVSSSTTPPSYSLEIVSCWAWNLQFGLGWLSNGLVGSAWVCPNCWRYRHNWLCLDSLWVLKIWTRVLIIYSVRLPTKQSSEPLVLVVSFLASVITGRDLNTLCYAYKQWTT